MMIVYGIPNCSTVKKARQWLTDRGIDYTFHDFKKSGVSHEMLERWIAAQGLERVLNRQGTTWRKLDDTLRASAETPDGAIRLMMRSPSLIKRPVLEHDTQIVLGFNETRYTEQFIHE